MQLNSLLSNKKSDIISAWFDLAAKTYPEETALFLKRKKDRFSNPVGHVLRLGTEGIVENLLLGSGADAFRPFLEDILRIRAVQDFSPSRAVGFLFLLKTAIRTFLKESQKDPALLSQLLELESKIDGLALLGFDIYMEFKQKVYEIRATELRDRSRKFMERFQKMTDQEGIPKDSVEDSNDLSCSSVQQGDER